MPELPAVEFTRQLIESNCLTLKVKQLKFFNRGSSSSVSTPDELIFTQQATEFVKNRIIGQRVGGVGRWGKHLWISFNGAETAKTAFLIHLGMTGFIQFKGSDRLQYESSPSNSKRSKQDNSANWPPKFAKFAVYFENDVEMVFCDARRFGSVDVLDISSDTNNVAKMVAEKYDLGFDPLIALPSLEKFKFSFIDTQSKRKINLKTLLMQQSFVCGIGNWMADDIMMIAGLLPQRLVSSLDNDDILCLYEAINNLTGISVEANADKSKFPKHWLFHIRWTHGRETLTGLKVVHEKIGGRSTYWIPYLQK